MGRSFRPKLIALLAATALLAGCSNRSADGPVNLTKGIPVGAVLALTGNANVYGQDQKIGIDLALAQLNGQAISLQIEDSGSDEPGANAAFNLQINRGVLALIGPTLSQQAFSADPIAQRRGVPVVAPSNTATGIPEIGHFISRVSAQSSVIAPLSIAKALQINPAIRRAAVFYAQDDAYSTAETVIFQKALTNKGLKPVTVQRTQLNDQDFQNQITSALSKKPDLIVLSLQAVDGGNMVRQLRELGYRGMIVVGNGMNTPNIYPICQKYCDGILIAQAYSPELKNPANQVFLAAFAKAQSRNPNASTIPPQLTAQAYTAMQVIGEALRRLDTQKPLKSLTVAAARKALMDEILGGTYQTPLGTISFTPIGEVVQKEFFVAQVRMNPGGRSGRFALLP
ncbi:ABC transporter substrate-binding protein [Cyanobium sp. WAJ14-Wanaka]|uniref:ABC transporter substrate-binding protein n=1 Tax=Cyanobium sp. WAJ14-Wanaka TaxID=2823725 RepID=UPI0020CEDD80|nr:ABC transporter substrate-binding protein [Cyanobium sp. WAJ14-Wanaka]MCP9775023.1 ABC transporter substrate-binding protein [Cyanobium sp. WAJ14-Wanaka]